MSSWLYIQFFTRNPNLQSELTNSFTLRRKLRKNRPTKLFEIRKKSENSIYKNIRNLNTNLQKVIKTRRIQNSKRKNSSSIIVSLVGYTNVGKSTLMNVISKSKVFSEDKLFATLDTTVRKVVVKNLPFLLSDTVGFIRKLPTQLIESFNCLLYTSDAADDS